MGTFFVWNVGLCLDSGKLSALRIATFCRKLHGISICQYKDSCSYSCLRVVSKKDYIARSVCWCTVFTNQLVHITWCQLIWWAIRFEGFNLATYDNRKVIKPNKSAVAYTNMIRGLAEIKTSQVFRDSWIADLFFHIDDWGKFCQGGYA